MGLIPSKKQDASEVNPTTLLIYAAPKMGKTTLAAALEKNLIIDLEKGSKYVEAFKVEVNTYDELRALLKEAQEMKSKGELPYRIATIDTATALEKLIMPLAIKIYKSKPMGKNYKGDDLLTDLANGAGYYYVRLAMDKIHETFQSIFEYIIYIAHVKHKSIEKEGTEITVTDIALTGKMASILPANVEAVGYLHRNRKNDLFLDFRGGDALIAGARPSHLRGQNIQMSSQDDKGKITYHWDRIYKNI